MVEEGTKINLISKWEGRITSNTNKFAQRSVT